MLARNILRLRSAGAFGSGIYERGPLIRLTRADAQKYSLKFSSLPNLLQFPASQAALAQLVEHSIRNRKVVGSNPTGGSNKINKLA